MPSGGAPLDGEPPAQAALRELAEECQVRGRIVCATSLVTYAPGDRHFTFLVDIGDQPPSLGHDPEVPDDDPILVEVRWLGLDQLPERDRAYLWAAGLLSVPRFADLVDGWGSAVSYPSGEAGHVGGAQA